jgi:hypothetical protein
MVSSVVMLCSVGRHSAECRGANVSAKFNKHPTFLGTICKLKNEIVVNTVPDWAEFLGFYK